MSSASTADLGAPAHRRARFGRGVRMIAAQVALHPRPFALAVVGAAIYATATVASSAALRFLIDRVVVPTFEDDGGVAAGTVLAGIGLVVGIGVVRAAGVVLRRVCATRAMYRIQATLAIQVTDRYQAQPLAWHADQSTGELVGHVGVDAAAATEVLAPTPYATGVALLILISAGWMLAIDPVLGGVAVALFPVVVGLNVVYQHHVSDPAEQAQDRLGAVSTVVHESVDGALVVKALGAEAAESARLDGAAAELRDAKVHVAVLRANFESLLEGLPALANVGLVIVGALRLRSGAVTVGDVTSFVFLFSLLVWPLRMIGYVLGDLPRSLAGYDRLQDVLRQPLAADPAAALVAARPGLAVDLQGVDLAYAGDHRRVLDGVDLQVAEGRTVAVVGPTGGGKSTLLRVVAGLLGAGRGTVGVVGGPRCLVFQEPFLFAASVGENVTLGFDLDPAAVWAALAVAQADGFVAELPGGLDTEVGERGVALSGGQRQRVALARALVRHPRLLLLDDATSALDPSTEGRVLTGLRQRLGAGVTTLIVATRPSTIALADEVVYVAGGRVLGHASHAELLVTVPGYRRLIEAYERDRAPAEEPA